MGGLLLPRTGAMDEVAAGLQESVGRYDTVHDATARLRGGGVDGVVVDAEATQVETAGVVRRFREAGDAAVVLAVTAADASAVTAAPATRVVDRSSPEAVRRALREAGTAVRLDAGERRGAAARALLQEALTVVETAAEDSLDSLGGRVVRTLGGTTPYRVAWLGRYDAERGAVTPVAAAGIPVAHLRAIPAEGSATVTAGAFRASGITIETSTTVEWVDGPDLLAVRIPTDPVAVLHLVGARPGGVPEPERAALRDLATALGEAVDDAQGGATDDRVRLLADALAHELSNQLGAAGLQLDLAEEHGDEEHFEYVAAALDRLEGLTAETRALAREQPDTERVDLERATTRAWDAVPAADASLQVESAALEADPALLRLALVNLLRNAVEHGRDDEATDSEAPTAETDDELEGDEGGAGLVVEVGPAGEDGVYVADDGVGIPPEERDRVLEWGHSNGGGNGVGLGLVALVADRHGWAVGIEESAAGGTRVVLGPEA